MTNSVIRAAWNTGRQYTRDGQLMNAVARLLPEDQKLIPGVDEYRVWFYDRSRLVTGQFTAVMVDSESYLKTLVMSRYDDNSYQPASIYEVEQALSPKFALV